MLHLIFLLAAPLFANGIEDRPPLPKPEVDFEVTGGLTPREYFSKRQANLPCREALEKAQKAEAAAPDAKKPALHMAYLEKVLECGDCDIVPPKEPILIDVDGSHSEQWYVSYGFCQLDLEKGDYETLVASLLDLKQYPAKTGGFSHMAEFIGYEAGTKKVITQPKTSPFDAFIAVKGPILQTGLDGAIGYFARNWYDEKVPNQFHLWFENTAPPEKYVYPSLKTPAGFPLPLAKLPHAKGSWYLTRDGYFRYFTAADFPGVLSFAATKAKEILLDTLLQFRARAQGAKR